MAFFQGSIGVAVDAGAIIRVDRRIQSLVKGIDKAVARARGTVLRRLPVEARRDITAEWNLKAGRITKDLRARAIGEGVILIGRDRKIGVIQYGARFSRRNGVTVQFKRGGPRERFGKSTFIATGLSGNRQVFFRNGAVRVMTKGRYAGKKRQPITAEYQGSVAIFLREPGRRARLTAFAQGIAAAELDRLLGTVRG
mgnify:CR=1 FL=1